MQNTAEETAEFVQVTGTIAKVRLKNMSKAAGKKKLYTRLTLKVEGTTPKGIKVDDSREYQRKAEAGDDALKVGDRVVITIAKDDVATPHRARIYELKRL